MNIFDSSAPSSIYLLLNFRSTHHHSQWKLSLSSPCFCSHVSRAMDWWINTTCGGKTTKITPKMICNDNHPSIFKEYWPSARQWTHPIIVHVTQCFVSIRDRRRSISILSIDVEKSHRGSKTNLSLARRSHARDRSRYVPVRCDRGDFDRSCFRNEQRHWRVPIPISRSPLELFNCSRWKCFWTCSQSR